MKKSFYLLLFALILQILAQGNTVCPKDPTFRVGPGMFLGTNGIGGSAKFWYKDQFGTALNIFTEWGGEVEGGELQFNYKFPMKTLVKPYALMGIGIQRHDVLDVDPVEYNAIIRTQALGAGAEMQLGGCLQHVIALELAGVYGKLEYNSATETTIGTTEQARETKSITVKPFTAKLMYHYYFIPGKRGDRDRDGITTDDICPQIAEDMDGFKDDDGCPDHDNDMDKIPDSLDRCPLVAEDWDGFEDGDGCPDFDNDGDNIADVDDVCPNEPEDYDQIGDRDGCPDEDFDNDKIIDIRDKCPEIAEDIDGFEDRNGCPDYDNDFDGIPDSVDQCPDQAEDFDDDRDSDGCFDQSEIVIIMMPKDTIYFKSNTLEFALESQRALLNYLDFLRKEPNSKIEVHGYSDNRGSESTRIRSSKRRAAAVAEYFTSVGIAKNRIRVKAFGSSNPASTNATPEGRAKNRRVEIIEVKR